MLGSKTRSSFGFIQPAPVELGWNSVFAREYGGMLRRGRLWSLLGSNRQEKFLASIAIFMAYKLARRPSIVHGDNP